MQASWEARAGPTGLCRERASGPYPPPTCCAGQRWPLLVLPRPGAPEPEAEASPCPCPSMDSQQASSQSQAVRPALPLGASAAAAFRGAPNNAAILGRSSSSAQDACASGSGLRDRTIFLRLWTITIWLCSAPIATVHKWSDAARTDQYTVPVRNPELDTPLHAPFSSCRRRVYVRVRGTKDHAG
jgi:hypothetical protein